METLKKWWFALSALALVVLYYMFDKRGRELARLHQDAQTQLLSQQLNTLSERSNRSKEDADKAATDYIALKSRHADLFKRLNLDSTKPSA